MDNELLDGFFLRDIRIEPLTGKVHRSEGVTHLPSKSVEVLLCLAKHPRRLVTREDLLKAVWGKGHGSAEALSHAVGEIRQVLGDHADNPSFIQTVPTRGYRLLVQPRDSTKEPRRRNSQWWGPPAWDALIRHGVVQAVGAYLILGWGFIQIAEATFVNLGLPPWSLAFVTYVVLGGIPTVVLLSWFGEIIGGHIVSDRGEESGGMWAGLGRNYPAIVAAYVIASVGVGIYQFTIGFDGPQTVAGPPPPIEVPTTVELIPVAENSVAVLKMTNLDGSDETDVFSKGLSEDILNRVARVPGLLVSARGDSWSLPENAPSELVRRRLRVAFYLESSVRIEDGLITVVAQFIDSSNGFHIFSRTFEVELAKFRGIQREITGLIVSEMRVALPEDMQDTIAPPMDDTQINAYVQYRRGKDILDLPQTAETIEQAAGFFQAALEIDPLYAAAHAGLCGSFTASYQLEGDTSEIVAAEQACGAALDAAPRLPLVHRATGNLYFLTSRLAEAEKSYQSALEFNEQDAEAMLGLARVYQRQQLIDVAEELTLRAIEVQPGNWKAYNTLGTMQYDLGQYAAAAETYRRVLYLDPNNFVAIGNMATAKMLAGDFEGAGEAFDRSLKIASDPRFLSNLGIIHYYLGEFEKSVEIHQQGVELSPNSESTWINLADALYFAGRRDDATIAFQKGVLLARKRIATDPTNAETLTYLAWAETMIGNIDEGILLSNRAIELAPDDPYSYYYRALIALRDDDEETAVVAVQKAIELGYPRIMLIAEPYLESLRQRPELAELQNYHEGEEQ